MKPRLKPIPKLVSIFLLFVYSTLAAQTKLPEFGQFLAPDLNLKECSFDPSADAVVIFDQATSNYDDQYQLITDRRIRLKILKEKGIERGNIRIRFYSKDKFEMIRDIDAVIATPAEGGKLAWNNIDRKSLYTKQLNNYYSEISFAMPNVKVGSIIEYRYKSVMESYSGLDNWYFQKDIPVMLSSYNLYILPNVSFNYLVNKSRFMPVEIQPNNKEGRIVFEMKNIPGLRDEAYSTSYRDYLQRVTFQLATVTRYGATSEYTTDWKKLNRELLESKAFGDQVQRNLPVTAQVKQQAALFDDAVSKMKFVYDFVQGQFAWNGINSRFSENLKTVVEKKTGNSGDLNLLLVNLLQSAGLDAYPMLVSERWHGRVDTQFSFLDQFNKTVALVKINGKNYVLDASSKNTPATMVPTDLLNTKGFVVDKKNYGFVTINDNQKKRSVLINLNTKVDAKGLVKGTSTVDFYGYARIGLPELYNSNKERYNEHFKSAALNYRIDSLQVSGLESDSLPVHNKLSIEYSLTKSGNYYLLNYNFFTGLEKNPFVADYRFTDIDFGARQSIVLNGNFELPGELTAESVPKNSRIVTPDNALQAVREIKITDNVVDVNFRIELNHAVYSSESYAVIKEFFSKLVDLLNEPVVLKVKS